MYLLIDTKRLYGIFNFVDQSFNLLQIFKPSILLHIEIQNLKTTKNKTEFFKSIRITFLTNLTVPHIIINSIFRCKGPSTNCFIKGVID